MLNVASGERSYKAVNPFGGPTHWHVEVLCCLAIVCIVVGLVTDLSGDHQFSNLMWIAASGLWPAAWGLETRWNRQRQSQVPQTSPEAR